MTLTRKCLILKTCQRTDYNAKITETEDKITSFTGATITTALRTIVNNIPDVSDLQSRTKYLEQNGVID